MQVTCLGATRTVTGSCFLVENERLRFLVDCGLFQGSREIEKRNVSLSRYRPSRLQYILLTHAHIDHCGLIPRIVKDGFRGKILCTRATFELCQIMLRDSAHIQEMDAEWQSRKNVRSGQKPVEPLYTLEDAEACFKYFEPVERNQDIPLSPDMRCRFRDAGHILGASFLEIFFQEQGREGKVVFSGDLGRQNALIVSEKEMVEEADYLFIESTYGDRLHKSMADSRAELLAAIHEGIKYGEKVLIPAFAVARTQEILFTLREFIEAGQMPSIPVFLDSPLAIAATEIFEKHPDYFNVPTARLLTEGKEPFDLPRLEYTRTPEESMAINRHEGPAIIIAASGMCNAGRIKHHLKHNLWRPGAQVVIIGFQAQGTLGRSLVNGAKKVRIFREEVAVRARIHTIGGFSAHADQQELLNWLGHFKNPGLQVLVIHGEESTSLAFAEAIQKVFPFRVQVPHWLEALPLAPPATRPAELTPETEEVLALFAALEAKFHGVKENLKGITGLKKAKIREIKALLKKTEKDLEGLMK
ncbi:MAG: MBL fold metallo-hydrolase [Desulfobacterota bacterium]|nr:MBL fold metallo-hydrolase [Thermodesulfobacteriota bacterium]